MQSGNLDRRIVIESATLVQNAYGEKAETWSTLYTCWGERLFSGGSESLENNQVVSMSNITYRIRYKSTITEQMRIKDGTGYYYITNIEEEGRRKYMLLRCERRDDKNTFILT